LVDTGGIVDELDAVGSVTTNKIGLRGPIIASSVGQFLNERTKRLELGRIGSGDE